MYRTSFAPIGGAAPVLGQRAQVGVVGDGDGQAASAAPRSTRSPRATSRQPRFGRHPHEAVAPADDGHDRHPDADRATSRARLRARTWRVSSTRSATVSSSERRPHARSTRIDSTISPPSPTSGHGQRIDRDLERQDGRSGGVRTDERRRPAGRALGRGAAPRARGRSDDQVAQDGADPAAGEPGMLDEVGARHRPAQVQLADDRAQVRAPDGLAALARSWARAGRARTRRCRATYVIASYKLAPRVNAQSRACGRSPGGSDADRDARRGCRQLDAGNQGRGRRPGQRPAGRAGAGPAHGDRLRRRPRIGPARVVVGASERPGGDRSGGRDRRDRDRRPAARAGRRSTGTACRCATRSLWNDTRSARGRRAPDRAAGRGDLGAADRAATGRLVHRLQVGLAAPDRAGRRPARWPRSGSRTTT